MRKDHRSRLALPVLASLALLAGACSDPATQPDGDAKLTRGDTSTGAELPATIHIYGRVLVSSQAVQTATVVDGASRTDTVITAVHSPVAGARVVVRRNELVNGAATQRVVAQTTSDANGRYDVPALPGAYYVVYATPPGGSALAESWELVQPRAQAEVNIYLGAAQQFVPPPDTNPSWNLGLKIAALEAFRGTRPAVDARWTMYTIEGDPIYYSLHAQAGRATLERDARKDAFGSSLDRFDFRTLELVRYVPAVWVNDREIRKESLLPVAPAEARVQPGLYLLRGRCAQGECEQLF